MTSWVLAASIKGEAVTESALTMVLFAELFAENTCLRWSNGSFRANSFES